MFAAPQDVPPELVEKFHLVSKMSGVDAMDRILDEVRVRKPALVFAPDSSPADIAAQLLLCDKTLFQEIYAEQSVAKARSFTYFVSGKGASSFVVPKDLSALEGSLNDLYEKHRRGRTAKIFWRQDESADSAWRDWITPLTRTAPAGAGLARAIIFLPFQGPARVPTAYQPLGKTARRWSLWDR